MLALCSRGTVMNTATFSPPPPVADCMICRRLNAAGRTGGRLAAARKLATGKLFACTMFPPTEEVLAAGREKPNRLLEKNPAEMHQGLSLRTVEDY